MRLAIMQPYIFPYFGYFQLLNLVEKFIIYDDVTFIKKGWINRNKVLLNGKEHMFTVPLKNSGQNVLIKDLELHVNELWIKKFLMTIEHAYSKASYFKKVFSIIESIVNINSKHLKDWHINSFEHIGEYLGINTILEKTSSIYDNCDLKGQNRILDICLKESANHYINPIGGQEMYDKDLFSRNGVKVSFLRSGSLEYLQFGKYNVTNLSIVDVMMFNSPQKIKSSFDNFLLV